jgi:hypothetical protein
MQVKGVELQLPLPSMTYADAMLRYGTDRPDTRYGLLLSDVTDAIAGCKLRCAPPTPRFQIQLCNLLESGWLPAPVSAQLHRDRVCWQWGVCDS